MGHVFFNNNKHRRPTPIVITRQCTTKIIQCYGCIITVLKLFYYCPKSVSKNIYAFLSILLVNRAMIKNYAYVDINI